MSETKKIYIKKLDIIAFGGIKNFSADLTEGFNVIYGKNESGKSTLNLFIKAMLYGLPTRKKSGEALKERERAIPWNEKYAEGKILLSDDGRDIEIIRVFGKRPADDKIEVRSSVSGESLPDYEVSDPGRCLFGISEEVFLKTCYISQGNAFMGGKDEEISKRLTNLEAGGDEDISADIAIKHLENLCGKLKAKDKRSKSGEIDNLEQRLTQCMSEKLEISQKEKERNENKKELLKVEQELKNTEEEIEKAEKEYKKCIEYEKLSAKREKLKQIEQCDKKTEDAQKEYDKIKELTEEKVTEAREKEKKIREIIDKNQEGDLNTEQAAEIEKRLERAKRFCLSGGIISAISVIGVMTSAIAIKSFIVVAICAVAAVLGVILLIYGITEDRNGKIKELKLEKLKADEENRREQNIKLVKELQDEVDDLLKRYGADDTDELYRLSVKRDALLDTIEENKKTRAGFLGDCEEEELRKEVAEFTELPEAEGENSVQCEKRLRELRVNQLEFTAKQNNLKIMISESEKNIMSISDVDTEISAINYRIKECERRLEVIDIAKSVLNDTATRWKENVTPELCLIVNEVMSALTSGKYDDIKVKNDFGMVFGKDGKIYPAEYLSCGTYEQIYLALRLAIFRLTCQSGVMFFDDIFTTYDEERADAAIKYLSSELNQCQTVVFTCHKTHVDMAKAHDANIINL